jgi:hypothetical protein
MILSSILSYMPIAAVLEQWLATGGLVLLVSSPVVTSARERLSPPPWWFIVVIVFIAAELLFYYYYLFILVPRANQFETASPYRDYPGVTDRRRLLSRIISRTQDIARHEYRQSLGTLPYNRESEKQWEREGLKKMLISWFVRVPLEVEESSPTPAPPRLQPVSPPLSTASSFDEAEGTLTASNVPLYGATNDSTWTIPGLRRTEMTQFLCWSLFGKRPDECSPLEQQELQVCYDMLESRQGLVFETESTVRHGYISRLLSLEPVKTLHRPLALYATTWIMQLVAGVVLRLLGFKRIQSKQGTGVLLGWYRPEKYKDNPLLPLVFFHGIAPSGYVVYLPMILCGMLTANRARRAVFIFENPPIASATIGKIQALSETDTVLGVAALLEQYLDRDSRRPAITITTHRL